MTYEEHLSSCAGCRSEVEKYAAVIARIAWADSSDLPSKARTGFLTQVHRPWKHSAKGIAVRDSGLAAGGTGSQGVQNFSACDPGARKKLLHEEFRLLISAMLTVSDLSSIALTPSGGEQVVVASVLGDVLMATNPRYPGSRMDSPSLRERPDEQYLMEQVIDGDEQSLIIIFDRYSSLAYKLAFHVVRNSSAAEDIVQEVFLRLWRQPKAYDPKRGSLSGWVAINARHRAVDYWRKHGRDSQMSKGMKLVEPAGMRSEYFQDIERQRTILAGLPDSERDILELSYFGGLSHSEIVLHTGLPPETVKSRIRQALQNLRNEPLPDMINQTTGKGKASKKAPGS